MATVLAEYHHSPLTTDSSGLWMSASPSPSAVPTAAGDHLSTASFMNSINGVGHLSPPSYHHQLSGSSDNLSIDIMGTPSPHHQTSPHHHCFSAEPTDSCPTGLLYITDFNTGCEMIPPQYSIGERSPDSGSEFSTTSRQSVIKNKVYSPVCHSPPTSEFDSLTMRDPSCTQLIDTNVTDYHGLPNGLIPYSVAHTPPPMYQPSAYTSDLMSCDVPFPPMFTRNHPYVDSGSPPSTMIDGSLPITLHDQAPAQANPILFYPDCTNDFNTAAAFMDAANNTNGNNSPPCYPFSEDFVRPPIKTPKRIRKPKPPASVDPSEIKDIPASAQLWEFLLKVLKKPKYAYMVSWENKSDGLFRFHDPPAFAALWGRHRNRPSMTYDKVARALRYYYRRDILEQVGGRLTYKFSPRLCKQFAASITGGSSVIDKAGKTKSTTSNEKKN